MKGWNRTMLAGTVVLALAGCGVETASTATTVAATKAREAGTAKQTIDQVRGQLAKSQQAHGQGSE